MVLRTFFVVDLPIEVFADHFGPLLGGADESGIESRQHMTLDFTRRDLPCG